ncbi:calcyphosin-like protein [Acanthaster planci]|uniref:Calcyphosin-like protein n=1 Tax=Acanthaster planci TaxID=133434 RepID=A0A8B7ZEP3_ACAPL|nr:calcyphosin-like protein [Acanthaster planci]XP_022101687.1 calcyphosin-like protein [Acanthaster planci]
MEKLRSKLLENDVDNIKKLGDLLRKIDRDNDDVLSVSELAEGMKDLGLEMPEDEVMEVFIELDKNDSNTVDLQEFFVAVRGCMSEAQLDICMRAYQKLDKDDSGVIDFDDLKDGYDFQGAARSVMSNEEAAKRFLLMFDSNKDGKVTKEEFLNYYAGRSRMSDDKFVKFVKASWKL